MTAKVALALALPMSCLVVVSGYAVLSRPGLQAATQNQRPEVLSGPDSWVAFDADVVVSGPGKPNITGRYHRASDGSDLLMTFSPDKTRSTISIHNIPESTFYYRFQDGEWYSAPMKLPPNGWRPTKRLKSDRYALHPYKLSMRAGQVPSIFSSSGFEAYQLKSPSGDMAFEVPDLNFFHLVRQSATGRREEYSNVTMREQSAMLFVPPTDAQINVTTEPDGIVSGRADEPEPDLPRHLRRPGGMGNHQHGGK